MSVESNQSEMRERVDENWELNTMKKRENDENERKWNVESQIALLTGVSIRGNVTEIDAHKGERKID